MTTTFEGEVKIGGEREVTIRVVRRGKTIVLDASAAVLRNLTVFPLDPAEAFTLADILQQAARGSAPMSDWKNARDRAAKFLFKYNYEGDGVLCELAELLEAGTSLAYAEGVDTGVGLIVGRLRERCDEWEHATKCGRDERSSGR